MLLRRQYLKFGEALREYFRSTSTHGLKRVGWSQHWAAKCIWALVFIAVLCGYILALILLLLEYFNYPTRILIEKSIEYQPFPGVTICNLNRLKAMGVGRDPLAQMAKFIQDAYWNISIPDGELSPYVRERRYFLEKLAGYGYYQRRDSGHYLSDFILHCSYRGRECDLETDFVQTWNNVYGNCYTFSGGKLRDTDQIKISNESGPLNGLSLVAYTEPDELMNTVTESKGIQLLIHPSTDMPFPEADGISLPPAMETMIGVEVKEYHYLGDPYSACNERTLDRFPYSYSAVACEKMCKQKEILHRCNCVDPTLPLAGDDKAFCPIDDIHVEKYSCQQSVLDRLKDGEIKCECPPPCIETRYETDFSLATWPTETHKDFLLQMLAPVKPNERLSASELKDMVAAKIFFKDIGKTVFTEKATFTFTDFLSHMGGLSALFIGISILSVVELLELLITLVLIPCVHFPPWPEDVEEPEMYPDTDPPTTTKAIEPSLGTADPSAVNDRPLPGGSVGDKKVVMSH